MQMDPVDSPAGAGYDAAHRANNRGSVIDVADKFVFAGRRRADNALCF